jgi:hypothetical protein
MLDAPAFYDSSPSGFLFDLVATVIVCVVSVLFGLKCVLALVAGLGHVPQSPRREGDIRTAQSYRSPRSDTFLSVLKRKTYRTVAGVVRESSYDGTNVPSA